MKVVLDLETTGLDYEYDYVVEVGAIAVNDDYEEVARFHAIVDANREEFRDPIALDMHEKNGLLAALDRGEGRTPIDVDNELFDWLKSLGPNVGEKSVVLVGRSKHFDLEFCRKDLPRAATLMSHRVDDTGAQLRKAKAAGAVIDIAYPHAGVPHRSMPDCENELAEAQAVWRWFRRAAASSVVGAVR